MTSIRALALALAGGAAVASSQTRQASLHVCVGADRVLRHADSDACPSGTISYELLLEGGGVGPPNDEAKQSDQQVNELRNKLDILSSKLADLQSELAKAEQVKAGGKVMAPFEVVDGAGRMIFRVKQDIHGFEMANPAGQTVLWASALDAGGVFKTRSSASFPEVVMGSHGSIGGLVIRDAEDQGRANLSLTNGKPHLELSNDNHVGIASLSQGASGGGSLQLGNAGGNAQVQAGVTSGGCGKVETYPTRPPGQQFVGVPGSFILGKGC
jgi:hypothetical protein